MVGILDNLIMSQTLCFFLYLASSLKHALCSIGLNMVQMRLTLAYHVERLLLSGRISRDTTKKNIQLMDVTSVKIVTLKPTGTKLCQDI